jgi:hypothetical protein
MKIFCFISVLFVSFSAFSQQEGDTLYKKCPVAIKDTVTGNNYFIEHQPASIKTYRSNGRYTVVIQQKTQYFTIFFPQRKLSTKGKYKFAVDADNNNEVRAKYSFKSGDDVAFIDVSSGRIETTYDKVTKLWHIKAAGLIANLGETRVSYFKATADFYIR